MKSQIAKDQLYMREALAEAQKALSSGNWPVGCVIVFNEKIVARGYNQVYSSSSKINHAEILAMNLIGDFLSEYGQECTLYVTYEPCPMCLGAILLNHFKRVVYGIDVDGSGALSLREYLPERFQTSKYAMEITGGILEEECKELFFRGDPVKRKWRNSGVVPNESRASWI